MDLVVIFCFLYYFNQVLTYFNKCNKCDLYIFINNRQSVWYIIVIWTHFGSLRVTPSKIEGGQRECHNTLSSYQFWDQAPNKKILKISFPAHRFIITLSLHYHCIITISNHLSVDGNAFLSSKGLKRYFVSISVCLMYLTFHRKGTLKKVSVQKLAE